MYGQNISLSNALVEVYLDDKLIASGSTAAGKAFFDSLPQTTVTVLAKKNGYEPKLIEVDLSARADARIDLTCLLPNCGKASALNKNAVFSSRENARGAGLWKKLVTPTDKQVQEICESKQVNCGELTNYSIPFPQFHSFSITLADSSTSQTISAFATASAFDSATGEFLDNTTSADGIAFFHR